jgi:predicted RNA-binding Zn-ribbon protein involved in translation (DUF1610 family)
MDRKYRQRGYMDSGRDREPRSQQPGGPKPETFGPRTPRMPGTHSVTRCSSCGLILPPGFDPQGKCPQCGFELHSCKQCVYFNTAARFECAQPIPERIAKKDARNDCQFYSPRVTVERQTSPGAPITVSGQAYDPRKAFENLFKK